MHKIYIYAIQDIIDNYKNMDAATDESWNHYIIYTQEHLHDIDRVVCLSVELVNDPWDSSFLLYHNQCLVG